MEMENRDEWPWTLWPDFIDLLRAFALGDEAQERYFPWFSRPRHFDMGDSVMLAEDAWRPTLAWMSYWASVLPLRADLGGWPEPQQAILLRLRRTFNQTAEATCEHGESVYTSRTSPALLDRHREPLRQIAREALLLFGEDVCPPRRPWDEIVVP